MIAGSSSNTTVAGKGVSECGFSHVCFGCGEPIACPCDVRAGRAIVYVTVAYCRLCRVERGMKTGGQVEEAEAGTNNEQAQIIPFARPRARA